MENQKYLLNGQAVHVVEQVSNGFLVQNIYTDNPDEENEFIGNDEPYFVSTVYDSAPTQKLDKRIGELESRVQELIKKSIELQNEVSNSERCLAEKKSLFKNYNDPAIQLLGNYLENKITYFVLKTYSAISILKREEVFAYRSDMEIYFTIQLSCNKMNYKVYARIDRNHSDYECYPCSSYEEAFEVAQKMFLGVWNEKNGSYKDDFIRCAERLNIPVPDFYIQKIKEEKKQRIESNIKDYEEKLRKELELLASFDSIP